MPNFTDRRYHMVSVTDPYDRVLGFLDRSRYFFFQVSPQLYSQGWVDLVPDLLLPRKSGSFGNQTRSSGYDEYTTEAVNGSITGRSISQSEEFNYKGVNPRCLDRGSVHGKALSSQDDRTWGYGVNQWYSEWKWNRNENSDVLRLVCRCDQLSCP
jgi:hypothetical protein